MLASSSVLAPRTAESRPIHVLPPEVVEQIAAGEVVERPISVVRELIDNALDAGATDIGVELLGGGLELIRVADNGHGIPADQVELAFARHATSKIDAIQDVYALHTLGFRGEALASIAAVAEVSLATRTREAAVGTLVVAGAHAVVGRQQTARQPGTTVTVRQLFANVPARRKFLGHPQAESTRVITHVKKMALGHPAVRFTLTVDGQVRQKADLSQMIWSVAEQISYLSTYFELKAGDAIFAGTPEGVGKVERGQTMVGAIEGLGEIRLKVV